MEGWKERWSGRVECRNGAKDRVKRLREGWSEGMVSETRWRERSTGEMNEWEKMRLL